jgi:alpha-beta hydrolase superfamily lysophospholipase
VLLAGGCAYWTEKQGELIFRPTKDVWRGFNGAAASFDEHWIPVGNGHKLHAWWIKAEQADAPVILYLHGARWNLTGSVTRVDRWRKLGFTVLAVDYRGFGQSSDLTPSEETAYEDAEAAWAYLAQIAPKSPRYIVGHSLGGAIAVELARRRPDAAGLVLEATFTSVREMIAQSPWSFLPVDLILTQEFDALRKIPELKVPLVVVHGTRDAIVPFEMGEKLYNAARSPKRFVKVEGGSHHNLSYVAYDDYLSAIAWLRGLTLKPPLGV